MMRLKALPLKVREFQLRSETLPSLLTAILLYSLVSLVSLVQDLPNLPSSVVIRDAHADTFGLLLRFLNCSDAERMWV